MALYYKIIVIILSVTHVSVAARSPKFQYQLDPSWPRSPLSPTIQGITSTAFDEQNRVVYVLQRGKDAPPVIMFDVLGNVLGAWGGVGDQREFVREHGIYVQQNFQDTKNPFIWITDVTNHTVKKFSSHGELLLTLGTPGIAGHSLNPLQFGNVADLTSDSMGNIYISDGDGGINDRVVKLGKNLNVAWSVGLNTTGSKPGQFASPHSVAWNSRTNQIIVADRENNRTQFLSAQTGKVMGIWGGNGACEPQTPWSVRVDQSKQLLIVIDGAHQPGDPDQGRLLVFDLSQTLTLSTNHSQYAFPDCEILEGVEIGVPTAEPHELGYDSLTGDVYVAYVESPPAILRYVKV